MGFKLFPLFPLQMLKLLPLGPVAGYCNRLLNLSGVSLIVCGNFVDSIFCGMTKVFLSHFKLQNSISICFVKTFARSQVQFIMSLSRDS